MIGDMNLAGGHDEFQKKLNEQDETAKVITSVFAALAVRIPCFPSTLHSAHQCAFVLHHHSYHDG